MAKKNTIDELVKVWNDVQYSAIEPLDMEQKELIQRYMNIFHVGPTFFVVYNTRIGGMEFVSPEIQEVLGINPEEYSVNVLMDILHPEDVELFSRFQERAVDFYLSLDPGLFLKYKYSFDFRYRTTKGTYKRLLQMIVPIHPFRGGGTRTLVIYTDISHLKHQGTPRLSFIGIDGEPSFYNIDTGNQIHEYENYFTKREQQVLAYIIENKSSQEIADLLHISLLTVQTHRKNIIRKSGSASMQDIIVKAVKEGWV